MLVGFQLHRVEKDCINSVQINEITEFAIFNEFRDPTSQIPRLAQEDAMNTEQPSSERLRFPHARHGRQSVNR